MHYPYKGPIPPKRTEDEKPVRFTIDRRFDPVSGNPVEKPVDLGDWFDKIGEPTKLPRGTPRK